MTVWDSREAEERNARQLVAERTHDLAKAKRQVRWSTAKPWLWGLFVLYEVWNLYARLGAFNVALAVVGLPLGIYGMWLALRGRRPAREVGALHEARLRSAQENYDRVFPNGESQ